MAIVADDTLQTLDRFLLSGDRAGGLDFLIEEFRTAKNFGMLFEARLMKKRLELGLPLIQTEAASEFPADKRGPYDQGVIEAARETGELALASGNIARAWPYFRAIGEPAPVAAAIDTVQPAEGLEEIIAIAFQEGVHPAKGMELILAQHGMCRAITTFGMYPVRSGREECISLLVRKLHGEVVERITSTIESQEGARPDTESIPALLKGREWLFGEYDYYVDTSHLLSLLQYCLEVKDKETLRLFYELCEYGKRLSQMFQNRGQPPFEEPYVDYGHYVQALLGEGADDAVAHFRRKVEQSDPEEVGPAPAQTLVNLLVRLGRYDEALEVSLERLSDYDPSEITCPSPLQLCHLARNYDRLKELARSRGDLLSYVAACVPSQA
ncbi:MAG: hypothetical protein ACRD7E_13015 [Bryobacteraceae bacterium]